MENLCNNTAKANLSQPNIKISLPSTIDKRDTMLLCADLITYNHQKKRTTANVALVKRKIMLPVKINLKRGYDLQLLCSRFSRNKAFDEPHSSEICTPKSFDGKETLQRGSIVHKNMLHE